MVACGSRAPRRLLFDATRKLGRVVPELCRFHPYGPCCGPGAWIRWLRWSLGGPGGLTTPAPAPTPLPSPPPARLAAAPSASGSGGGGVVAAVAGGLAASGGVRL